MRNYGNNRYNKLNQNYLKFVLDDFYSDGGV